MNVDLLSFFIFLFAEETEVMKKAELETGKESGVCYCHKFSVNY